MKEVKILANFKIGRIQEDIKRELTSILREVKDHRVSKLLSVIRVEVSGDLSHCKINVSAIEGFDKTKQSVEGLESAKGFIKKELCSRLKLRKCPELHFIADNAIEYSTKINSMLEDLN